MVGWLPLPRRTDDAVDVVALLPIAPLDPRTGGERYNRIVLDGLQDRGLRVAVVDRAALREDPREVLRYATEHATRVLVDTWLYRDLHAVVPQLSATRRAKLVTLSHLCYWRTFTRPWVRALHRRRTRRLLSAVGHRIGVSRAVLDHDLGPHRHPLLDTVAYPGCEIVPARTMAERACTEILSVANYHPRKGFDLLIEALAMLRESSPELFARTRLRLVGDLDADPAYVASLRQRTRELRLDDRVSMDGWTDRAGVAERLSQASLFTLASNGEGFGMVVAEALRFGVPAVVTPFETADELLGGAANTAIVPRTPRTIANAWRGILARRLDAQARAVLSSRGAQIARPWEVTLDILHDVLFPGARERAA